MGKCWPLINHQSIYSINYTNCWFERSISLAIFSIKSYMDKATKTHNASGRKTNKLLTADVMSKNWRFVRICEGHLIDRPSLFPLVEGPHSISHFLAFFSPFHSSANLPLSSPLFSAFLPSLPLGSPPQENYDTVVWY